MNYTRNIILFLLSLICAQAYCQNISVKSFRLLDNDLTANTAGTTVLDQNGDKAALVKVVTTQTGFSFDCGSIGVVKTVQKPSEIWVYVPQGARRITISHPQLGILRDYEFPMSIEKARTYEMVLTTDQIQTVIQHSVNAQYLVMHIKPENAIVKIDDIEIPSTNGTVSKLLSYGKHTFSVSDPFYEEKDDTINIGSEKKEISVSLNPAYEIYNISTSPENGATVTIDDESTIYTTPFNSPKLKKGKHKMRIRLEQYATKDVDINVKGDGLTHLLMVHLSANFGILTVTSLKGSDIYINKEFKGKSLWSGRLTEGIYEIEAKMPSYKNSSTTVNIIKGTTSNIKIADPIPIFGSLDISCNLIGANIYIDNKLVGTSPTIINNILIGEHNITISNTGYISKNEKILIKEGKVTEFRTNLEKEEGFVDLGISVKWSTCNLGAKEPWEYGDFYAWGEINSKNYFNRSSYNKPSANYSLFSYNRLQNKDDAAYIKKGENWRIPTEDEMRELIYKCKWKFTKFHNITGYEITGPNGNSIFLPAAGRRVDNTNSFVDICGNYWTSNIDSSDRNYAKYLDFYSKEMRIRQGTIYNGFSIRPVHD